MKEQTKLSYTLRWIWMIALPMTTACTGAGGHENQKEAVRQPVRIEVAPATIAGREVGFRYNGTIEPQRTTPLSFQINGTIEKVFVDEGDAVRAGELLATLDATDFTNAKNTTKAAYERALDAYNRLKPVHESGSLPDVKWVEVTTTLEQARAMLNMAENNLKKTSLYAPEDGIIGTRKAEPGMSSLQVEAPFVIIDIRKVLVKIAVPEQEVPLVSKNAKASILVRALGNKTYQGIVRSIGVSANVISRTYDIKIEVDNPGSQLLPGMVCDVNLDGMVTDSVLTVPSTAITTDSYGKPQVYLLDHKTMQVDRRSVVTGPYIGNDITILKGLAAGDDVVVKGKEKIYPHCKVAL